MKHEWRKQEKELYCVGNTPRLTAVAEQKFITISGKGNPNDTDFSQRVAILYSLAYAVKAGYKSAAAKESPRPKVSDFTVYPLEGCWGAQPAGTFLKQNLEYTIMIRQPDFITEEAFLSAWALVKKKKPSPLLEETAFHKNTDGLCAEILHTGSYDDEPSAFARMDAYVKQQGLCRAADRHREIYLNNSSRVPEHRLKTILRYRVEPLSASEKKGLV